jgi:5-formyltetrahydrofolate cyclo-ligase
MEFFLRRQAKAELRKRRRAMRKSIPENARAARSAKIVDTVVADPAFAAARRIALFWPMLDRNEIDIRPLDRIARAQGKVVAYPLLLDLPAADEREIEPGSRPEDMRLMVADPSVLEERGHGFAEPPSTALPVAIDADLLVIVPALAVDPNGHRIGYGRGYYDRLLARIAPPAFALAVAYDFDVVAEVPVTEGDYPVDTIVTDARTFRVVRTSPG